MKRGLVVPPKVGRKYKYVYLGSEDNMHRIRNDDAVDIVEKWDEERHEERTEGGKISTYVSASRCFPLSYEVSIAEGDTRIDELSTRDALYCPFHRREYASAANTRSRDRVRRSFSKTRFVDGEVENQSAVEPIQDVEGV
jgi:hypothetical protein